MKNYISGMPLWAIALFIVSFLLSLGMFIRPVRIAALNAGFTPEKSRRLQIGVLLFYVGWLAYASVLSLTGFLFSGALPPRVLLFTTVPLFVILFGIIGNTRLFKTLLRAATLDSLIFLHVFRFVGVFFLLLLLYHLLPTAFAISADAGDVITALFAIPVARAVAQKKSWSTKAVYVWNVFGILDIFSLMTFAVIGAVKNAGPMTRENAEMLMFPFVWFPAFAPATILFLHAAIFRKMRLAAP